MDSFIYADDDGCVGNVSILLITISALRYDYYPFHTTVFPGMKLLTDLLLPLPAVRMTEQVNMVQNETTVQIYFDLKYSLRLVYSIHGTNAKYGNFEQYLMPKECRTVISWHTAL